MFQVVGKLPVDKERLIILLIMGPRTDGQLFNWKTGIESCSLVCERFYRWNISVSYVYWKRDKEEQTHTAQLKAMHTVTHPSVYHSIS